MLKSIDSLETSFSETRKKSEEQCKQQLSAIFQFINDTVPVWKSHIDNLGEKNIDRQKIGNSLLVWVFIESPRTCGHTLFLTLNGLYRNAIDNIRHLLEAEIQALYLDLSYRGINNVILSRPEPNVFVKIAILREVEDKRDYHSVRLIDELHLDYKDRIRQLYKELSQEVHPSHKQIEQTMTDFYKHVYSMTNLDCEEVGRILSYLINVYDVLLFFYLTYLPEVKNSFFEDEAIANFIKKYDLYLVSKLLKQHTTDTKK
jgi:hypothetical protein